MSSRVADNIRWRRILRSCTLDLRSVELPLTEPSGRDFIVAGCPRSGTSLVAAMLFQPPAVAVSMEPWDGMRLTPDELFASLRREIDSDGKLTRGRLDSAALSQRKVQWNRDSSSPTSLGMSSDYTLGVKWPSFWRYLPYLHWTKFLICVRDPLEVVDSFERTGGRLRLGLDYDIPFNHDINSYIEARSKDHLVRRVLHYEYVYSRVLPFLERRNVMAVRYEDWFNRPNELLDEISQFLQLPSQLLPTVDIKPPSTRPSASFMSDLIKEYAPTARLLGYDA